jgi:cell division initiation protein
MRITPLDIRKQEFRKAMRGLDAEEVYAFLSTVGDEYEAVLNDNKALRERVIELDEKVQEFRSLEKTLRNTLLTAERVTVEAKDNARREANLIIKEAQIEADRSLRDIKSEAMRLRQEVSQLRSQRESYLGRMKVIAESLLKFIESVEVDFYKEDDAYKEQLPETDVADRKSTRPDPSIKNGNLFEGPGDKRDAASSSTSAAVAGAAPAPPAGVEQRFPGVPAAKPDAGPEAIPSPRPDDARNGSDSRSAMAKINSIIERMAEGHDDVDDYRPQREPGADPRASRQPEPFDPASAAPAGPIASGELADEPPKTLEATTTTDDPTPARGIPSVRPQSGPTVPGDEIWEREPEVVTAVETADEGEIATQERNADDKVTSEISLEQIRRDLERRMSEEKDDK